MSFAKTCWNNGKGFHKGRTETHWLAVCAMSHVESVDSVWSSVLWRCTCKVHCVVTSSAEWSSLPGRCTCEVHCTIMHQNKPKESTVYGTYELIVGHMCQCRVRKGTGSQSVVVCIGNILEVRAHSRSYRILLKLLGVLATTGCQGYTVLPA